MKMVMAVVVLTSMVLFVNGSVGYALTTLREGTEQEVVLTNSDNELATTQLVAFMRSNGVNVTHVKDDWFAVKSGTLMEHRYVCEPKMSDEIVDRIIVRMFFGVEDKYKKSPKTAEFTKKLNEELNIGQFYQDSDGDLVLLSFITFVNRLDIDEFNLFIKFMELGVLGMALTCPEAVDILQ